MPKILSFTFLSYLHYYVPMRFSLIKNFSTKRMTFSKKCDIRCSWLELKLDFSGVYTFLDFTATQFFSRNKIRSKLSSCCHDLSWRSSLTQYQNNSNTEGSLPSVYHYCLPAPLVKSRWMMKLAARLLDTIAKDEPDIRHASIILLSLR